MFLFADILTFRIYQQNLLLSFFNHIFLQIVVIVYSYRKLLTDILILIGLTFLKLLLTFYDVTILNFDMDVVYTILCVSVLRGRYDEVEL